MEQQIKRKDVNKEKGNKTCKRKYSHTEALSDILGCR
jgi:hypothetical protein